MFTHFVYEGVFSAAAVSMAVKTSKDSRTKKEHNFFFCRNGSHRNFTDKNRKRDIFSY